MRSGFHNTRLETAHSSLSPALGLAHVKDKKKREKNKSPVVVLFDATTGDWLYATQSMQADPPLGQFWSVLINHLIISAYTQ